MVVFSRPVNLLLALLTAVSAAPASQNAGVVSKRQAGGAANARDAWDHSWIEAFTSLGDSYSVGLGAGHAIKGSANVQLNTKCKQYSYGYPNLLNANEMIGENANRKMQYLGCSGAVTTDILKNQIPLMEKAQLVTISTGGNDAHLATILNYCIYEWATKPWSSCDKELRKAFDEVNSAQYTKNFQDLMAAVTPKLADDTSRMYWTGYERFFDDTTNQCDKVTWSFAYKLGFRQFLKQARRTQMNQLADLVNSKIKAVCDATPRCVFVDTNAYNDLITGHYCEPGVDEAYSYVHGGVSKNREQTFFYEWGTTKDNDDAEEKVIDYPQKRQEPDIDPKAVDTAVDPPLYQFDNATFEGNVAYWIMEGLKDDNIDPDTSNGLLNDPENGSFLPDKYGRVFHRTKFSNGVVARNILRAMDAQQAAVMGIQAIPTPIRLCNQPGNPLTQSPGTSPAGTLVTVPGLRPPGTGPTTEVVTLPTELTS